MTKLLNKVFLVVILILLNISGVQNLVLASDFKDELSNSMFAENSMHRLSFVLDNTSVVTDGSMKINFDDDFDVSAITSGDVAISGGNVIWGGKLINPGARTIVVQFAGDLNSMDGEIVVEIGDTNYIRNPFSVGNFEVGYGLYNSLDGTGLEVTGSVTKVHIDEGIQVSASVSEVLVFNVSGVGAGEMVNGFLTNTSSTSNMIDFGTMFGAGNKIAAHDLSVLTNAPFGYVVETTSNHKLESGSNFVSDFVGTNVSPANWIVPSGGIEGYFGYTTDDLTLGNIPANRFTGGKWAGFSSTVGYEIMYNNGPADGATINEGKNRVGYRLQISDFQPSGVYGMTVTYVCVPSF